MSSLIMSSEPWYEPCAAVIGGTESAFIIWTNHMTTALKVATINCTNLLQLGEELYKQYASVPILFTFV